MEFEINTDFAGLSADEFKAYLTSLRAAVKAGAEGLTDESTDADIEAVETLAAHLDEVEANDAERVEAGTKKAERLASLKGREFASDESEDEEDEEDEDDEDEEDEEDEAEVEEAAASVKTLSRKVKRPAAPASQNRPVTITAAADVPDFATGQALDDLSTVGDALISRMRGFGVPTGDGQSENLQHYGVAKFNRNYPEDLTIKPHEDDLAVLSHAAKESRLTGGSLTAAGGWCAPSETLYDLCTTETLEGILSVPEVSAPRGGIKFTKGPDFSAIYAGVGFLQTEAQAISGTTKACYEVVCPSWTDVRLDAIGLCIKAPILTNAAYPELVNRILSGAMIAHAHKVNASVIGRMVTAAGAAEAVPDFSSTAQNLLANLELLANYKRQEYVMGFNETMEVVLPFWTKAAIRADLSLRTGQNSEVITDEQIMAHFAARKLNVQFVYDWQALDITNTTEGYPATVNALLYPAGTFVKATTDIITLNAVYDAASLATNVYTALFFEEGLAVANICHTATLATLGVCNSGRTGIANLSVCQTAVA